MINTELLKDLLHRLQSNIEEYDRLATMLHML